MGKNEISLADNLINIINTARENAFKKVNEELINMYWQVGEYLHREAQKSTFGDSYIDSIANEIQEEFPGIKGFNRRGLYRMKQFYETYAENEVVTPLVTQINWTNHLLIMSGCKSDEEREFYIRLCIKEKYSKRQLQRQMDSGYYERYMLSKDTLLPESVKKLGENPFLDSYVTEFLDLPNEYHENDLRKALIKNMKDFILELGKDFTFIDEEYKVQVGGDDFRIDLLFFHRGLQCLVAIELKIGKFKPEYVSKLDFYLEALDRQVKKENENPRLVIIDPVQAFIGADVDMNRANKVRSVFRKLGMIAEKTGCAIVLIGHLNKSSGTQSTYRGFGSIDIMAAVRSLIFIGKARKDCEPLAICNQAKYNEEKKEAISMARTANVFARVEPEVKEQAEQVLDRLGIPMSNAVGMFLRQIVLQRGIPFEMKLPAYEELVAYGSLTKEQFDAEIEKGMEDIKAGRVYSADEVEAEMKREFGI